MNTKPPLTNFRAYIADDGTQRSSPIACEAIFAQISSHESTRRLWRISGQLVETGSRGLVLIGNEDELFYWLRQSFSVVWRGEPRLVTRQQFFQFVKRAVPSVEQLKSTN